MKAGIYNGITNGGRRGEISRLCGPWKGEKVADDGAENLGGWPGS